MRTHRVHRPLRGRQPWWRTAVIYEFRGFLDEDGLAAATGYLPVVKRLGADAVLLRPSYAPVSAFSGFSKSASALGLRVIVRVSGSAWVGARGAEIQSVYAYEEMDPLRRAASFVACGAQGIDIGHVTLREDSAGGMRAFSEYLQNCRAELSALPEDEAVLLAGGSTHSRTHQDLEQLLTDDYVDQVRDDGLVRVQFGALDIVSVLHTTISNRNSTGAALAWNVTPPALRRYGKNTYESWYGADQVRRSRAMNLLGLGLPGCVFIASGDEVDLVDEMVDTNTALGPQVYTERIAMAAGLAEDAAIDASSTFSLLSRAIARRKALRLANSSWSWVESEAYPAESVLLATSGELVTILNTGTQPVVASASLFEVETSATEVRTEHQVLPGACSWFRFEKDNSDARVRPLRI